MGNRIFVAIDTPDLERARLLAQRVRHHVGGIKLGLEFFCAHGPAGVRAMEEIGLPVFLDLKLHDIPNTVAKAVQSLAPLAPAVLTVHASGGRAMLEDAKAAAHPSTKVVAVTMLTSLDDGDLAATGVSGSAHDHVLRLSDLAREAGLDGIVCSGAEVKSAHQAWPKGYFVVPGVRLADGAVGDQKRVVTPRAAIDAGASMLVIGRPITQAEDPDAAARAIVATL
ncbi:orotidine-5'-phosphate decarboxylase [Sphingomonas endophytica]|uniref:Orotidine 5'-phosphate decarboxylase n=1 Tax=Sphingomonas endophytica TaxID=869719 RepID=A0A147IA50_9SPHN|nr:orotidine-5'-phosphate decarboxylase [Sphingomonas endophytica]KTT76741.1 orotidine 5'-phosphate decarboxylase [Sphingomonas endophytica]